MGSATINIKPLVTGGGGFLGSAIVKALSAKNHDVKTIQRHDYPFLREWGVQTIRGDLSKFDDINQAVQGRDIVFHVAAKTGIWGDYADYYQANVVATENVIKACKENKINYLVYTSTPSVVFDGKDEVGINESAPYAKKTFNAYQKTKIEAEKLVLNANSDTLKTVALRPHLIWGPGDPHLVSRLIARARADRLRLPDSKNKQVDSCYIDNAAHAHILAANCLAGENHCAGKAYFISNDEPLTMAELINRILSTADLAPVNKKIPENRAYALGYIMEKIYSLLDIKTEPVMTRFVARQLSTSHWFDLSAAKHDLGYQPLISIDDGIKLLKDSFS